MLLGIALFASAWTVPRAVADVKLGVRESSWSVGRNPNQVETLVETSVQGARRRVESQASAAGQGAEARPARSVQIDRVDRDSSYFFRPDDRVYLPIPFSGTRATNLRSAQAFLEARTRGIAPRDTLPPVRTIDLGRVRTILGEACKGVVVELVFSYRDSAMAPEEQLTGVLSDTLWLAPASSAAWELRRFEQDFARATAADSFLAAANAVQLSQVRGQGLVSVLQRAIRALPGYPLESTFVNLLYGLPRGLNMGDVERRPDGAVVVQRTVRRAIALSSAPLAGAQFEVPRDLRPVDRRP
jgi:hypothetical protein